MDNPAVPVYQMDQRWKIVKVNEAFCRAFKCTGAGVIGRDVRDLMRSDWRLDFRTYVTNALVGAGDVSVTLPMVAPCGKQGWYKHNLEPLMDDGSLSGYRATIQPQVIHMSEPSTPWWGFRATAHSQVWDVEANRPASRT